MRFNEITIKEIRKDINTALVAVAEKHGISIKTANATYDATELNYKVICNVISESGEVITRESKAFESIKEMIGLGHLSVGQEITFMKEKFILKGYNGRASKMPINISNEKGNYKISTDMLLRAMPAPKESVS